jgi:hypothetical protein
MTSQSLKLYLRASGMPETIEQHQLGLDAAFAAGRASVAAQQAQPESALTDKEQIAKNKRDLLRQMQAQPERAPSENVAQDAFDAGFRCAAGWAQRDDLFADIDSPTYKKDRSAYIVAIKQGGQQ